MSTVETIVFFDGVCGLCNGLIDFLLRRDRTGHLRFAPLQGETARSRLSESEREDLDSIVVFYKGEKLKESTAVLKALSALGGLWSLAAFAALLVPAFIRNLIYRFIARNRYRWFGRLDVCRIPTAAERSRFLD